MANHQIINLVNYEQAIVGPTGQHTGRDITIQNISPYTVYLGGVELNENNYGYRLLPGAAWSVELRKDDHIYAFSENDCQIAVFMLGLESFNG